MLRGVCPPGPPSFRSIERVPRRPYPPVQTGKGSLQVDVTDRKGVRFAQLAHGCTAPSNCVKTSLKRLILRNPAASGAVRRIPTLSVSRS
jgi:hypothetical protein